MTGIRGNDRKRKIMELKHWKLDVDGDHLACLAILSAKDNGFAAGADIDEFTQLKDADEAIAFTVLGNEVFDKIAALPFPTVALVHGFCMGGGTELALACRYRVMDDGPKSRMALPEVMLGIVP